MSIIWIDGFDTYNGTSDVGTVYSTGGTTRAIVTGRVAGQSVSVGSSSTTGYFRSPTVRNSATGTATFGFAMQLPSLPSGTFYPIYWFFGTSGYIIRLSVTSAGALAIVGPTMGANSFGNLAAGTWYYIEVVVPCNSSCATGTIQLWINGTKYSSNTATFNSTSSGTTSWLIQLGDGVDNGQAYFDDLYIADEATGQTGPFGDSHVTTIYPGAAGNYAQWTPLSGTNYSNVNEAQENGATSYVSTLTDGYRDSYLYNSLPDNPTSIYAVKPVVWVADSNGSGTHTLNPFLRVSSTNYDGTTSADLASASYRTITATIWETNPNISAAWATSAINSIEAGVKLVS